MKLRINTKLRAALIAAITTVGFTIQQAQATWEGGPDDDHGGRGHIYYIDNGKDGVSLTDTSRDTFWLTGNAKSTTASMASVTAKDGALVHISGTNSWHDDYALTMLTIQSIKAASDTGTITISTQPYSSSAAASSTNVNIQSVGGKLGGLDNYGVLTLGADGSTINASGTLNNNSGATLTLNGAFVFDVADASRYAVKSAGEESWSDAANKQGFKTSTGASYYVIQGATEGSNLSVTSQDGQPTIENSGGDYYFTSTGTVTDHSKFYVNAATATLNENLSGQLIVNKADAMVTVDGATFSGTVTGDKKFNLIVQNGGKLTLAGEGAFGGTNNTITIGEGGTVDLNGKADANYTYTMAGGTLTNTGEEIGYGSSQTVGLILTAGSTVHTDSGHDFRILARGYNATTLNLNDHTLVKTGTGTFTLKNTTVNAGTIEVRGGEVNFEVDPQKGGSTAANITLAGGNVSGTMKLTGDITLTALQNVSTGVGINAQNHGLTLAGAGDLTLTGSITNVSGITKTGAGAATINASGSLNKSIAVQQGSLVLSGTYAIDGIKTEGDNHYVDASGETSTSGFYYQSGSKTVYTKAEGATLTTSGTTFTFNNETVTVGEDGKFAVDPATDKTTVWVNGTDTVEYDTYYAASGETPALTTAKVAGGATLVLGEQAVGTLAYQENGTTINLSGKGTVNAISGSGTLNLHEGAQASMAGTVTINSGESFDTTGAGALTVETLKVNGGTVNVASNLTVTGGGNGKGSGNNSKGLSLTGSGSTVNINGGTTTVTGAVYTNGGGVAINVGTGDAEATLVAGRIELGDNGGGTGSFTIGKKGKVVVTGNEDYRNDTGNPQKNTSLQMAEWGQQMTDTVQGKLYAQGATAFMSNDADSTVNIDGGTMAVKGIVCSNVTANRSHNINLGNNGKLVLGERGIAAESGNWNITLASGEIGMTADTTLGRDMTVTGPVTFNTAKYTWEGSGADLELKQGSEGGTMTVTGTISGSGAITKTGSGTLNLGELDVTEGSFAVNAGTVNLESATKTGTGAYTLSGDGTVKLGLYGIDLQGGTLTMSGKYDISDVYVEGGDPTYEGGHYKGNGFAVVDGTATVVSITGGTLDTTGATFTWNGQNVDVDNTTGKAAVTGTSYGTFYIFTESETVVTAKSKEGEHGTLSSIYIEEGATLEVDENINGSLIDGWSTGTVKIQESMTVTGTMAGVTLSGAGTYALADNTVSLGSVTLGENWTGTVRLSNINKSDGNTHLDALVQGESWVEISGIKSGFLPEWSGGHVDVNIKLTNPDAETPAWVWNDGSGSTNYTLTFAGDWAGQGTFRKEADKHQSFTWTGNIAAWTGKFEYASNDKTSNLTFAGSATQVNAEIAKPGTGTLNLIVGNGTDAFSTEFTKSVTVSSITVKDNASATFNELHITSAINNSGTVIFNEGFEVSDFQVTDREFGYYDTEGNFSVDGNGYAGFSASYITIVNGGSVNADEITVTQEAIEYTMNNSGRALADDAEVQHETYFVRTDTVDVSAIKADGQASKVEVAGGTLNVDQATDLAITVTEEGTLTGEKLDASEIGIGEGAAAYFAQGLESGGVKFSSGEDSVDVYNYGVSAVFSLNNSAMMVSAQSITKITGDDVTVSNWLYVDEITNEQGGALTLNGQEDAVTVNKITVGLDSTVEVLDQSGQESTITVTETLAAGGGTLLANLVMADDSALLVNGVEKALHVGSTLTMGSNIALDGTTLQALDDLAIGEFFWLIDAAEGRELVYEGPTGDDAWYDSVFSRTAADGGHNLEGDFNIVFNDELDAFGLQKFSDTPEPTTGTLSLLALAALAARRRRK